MKIIYSWLKEFVKINYPPARLADMLTMLGFETESVADIRPSFSGVTAVRINKILRHPNADKLTVCIVDTGKESVRIVCGAKNIKEGDIVPAALPGAVLPGNIRITKRALRGVESAGMLCSEKELGLSDDSKGIFILSRYNLNSAPPRAGTQLNNYPALKDTVLEINVTPNRPDALSIVGIAREISAAAGRPLKYPEINYIGKGPPSGRLIDVKVRAHRLCPRYTARVIQGVKVCPAPFWIRRRICLTGARPINNAVDITNYILFELGQPLHVFDYNLIAEHKIIVRRAGRKEVMDAIDGTRIEFTPEDLVIADAEKPIASAGIMGGKDTEVTESTKDICLESAYFKPSIIRKTSKRTGLQTESSYRFERGTDYELPPRASSAACRLIAAYCGGIISKGIIDHKKEIPPVPSITIPSSYCRNILGIDISPQKLKGILERTGCRIKKTGNRITVRPPSWRQDIVQKADVAEEAARAEGYNNIPAVYPKAELRPPFAWQIDKLIKKLYVLLPGMGMSEVITYSFVNPDDLSRLDISEPEYLKIINPVDKNISIMRPSILPGIMNTIAFNTKCGNASVHIFEIGRCFSAQKNGVPPKENYHLAMGITGAPEGVSWGYSVPKPDFYYIKGVIETCVKKLFLCNISFTLSGFKAFHPAKQCSAEIQGAEIGRMGEIRPEIARKFGIKDTKQKIYAAELNITRLQELVPHKPPRFRDIPRFPSIRRDISIILDKRRDSCDIIKAVKEAGSGSELIESVRIFDVYEGSPVPEGKKSVSCSVIYRHKKRTLTDKEVDSIHNEVCRRVLGSIPSSIRE